MLITVTTTSQKLSTILSDAQSAQATVGQAPQDGYFRVLIQVLGATNVYADFGSASTVAGGIKIIQGESVSFATDNLAKINLIAETSNNTNVRVLIN